MHREWRLSPDRVVAVYIRQDHEGELYYYPFNRFASDHIGDMETSVIQGGRGARSNLYLRRFRLIDRGDGGGIDPALDELVVGVATDDTDLALLLQLPHLLHDP